MCMERGGDEERGAMEGEVWESVLAFIVEHRVSFVSGKWKCCSIVTLDVFTLQTRVIHVQYVALFSCG